MAFRLLHGSEVRHHLGGFHDYFSQQQGSGTNHLRRDPHDPHQRMYLRQIPTVGSQCLPDIGNRIQADDVHPLIAEEQHICRHVVKYSRIPIVQIPLIGIEGGHDHLSRLVAPGEVSGSGGGEHLRYCLLVFIGDVPVIKEEVTILEFLLSRPGTFCPLMVLTGMIHDKIKTYGDSPCMTPLGQRRKILHGSQGRLHRPEIRHRISAVRTSLGAGKQRHQMQIVHSAFLDIIQMGLHTLQGSGKGIGIHEHSQHLISGEPLRHGLPAQVPFFQFSASVLKALIKHFTEILKCLHIIAVQLGIQPFQLVILRIQPIPEGLLPAFLLHPVCRIQGFLHVCHLTILSVLSAISEFSDTADASILLILYADL